MATYSSIAAWRNPWTKESVYSPKSCKESDKTEATYNTAQRTFSLPDWVIALFLSFPYL